MSVDLQGYNHPPVTGISPHRYPTYVLMASSRRPRSSTTSLAPRSLRTFRALARVRRAFPLIDVAADTGQTRLRMVLVGSPDATPAALRSSIRVRQALLDTVLSTTSAVKLQFIPGAGSLGRRVFRSRSLADRRTLLQGGSAILQFNVPRSTAGLSGLKLTKFLAEAVRPFPGFNPVAYLLALPAVGSTRSTSVSIHRVGLSAVPTPSVDNAPQFKILTQLGGRLGQSLQVPLTLSTRAVTPLLQSRTTPATYVVTPTAIPALRILEVLTVFVGRRAVQTPKGQSKLDSMVQGLGSRIANPRHSGSSPLRVWGHSSVGRADALQASSQRFDSACLHSNTYMLARLLLDRRRRMLSNLYEPRRRVLRALIEAQELPARLRGQAYRALLRLPRDSSPTRIRNRCPLTGRGRAIVRRFGLSRLIFRSLANAGRLVGVKKASWLYFIDGRSV